MPQFKMLRHFDADAFSVYTIHMTSDQIEGTFLWNYFSDSDGSDILVGPSGEHFTGQLLLHPTGPVAALVEWLNDYWAN